MKRQLWLTSDVPSEIYAKVLDELVLGYLNLNDEMFEQAELNFLLAIQYDNTCAEAYWGLMLVKCRISNEDLLNLNPTTYKDVVLLPECKNAFKYADEEQKQIFQMLLENIITINEGDKY